MSQVLITAKLKDATMPTFPENGIQSQLWLFSRLTLLIWEVHKDTLEMFLKECEEAKPLNNKNLEETVNDELTEQSKHWGMRKRTRGE